MGKYSDILKQQKPSGKYSQMMAQAQPAVGGGIGSSYQKMGETILEKASEVGSSIGEKFQDAAEQFRQGDILAGIGAGGRAGLQTLMSPISVATEVVKETPLKPLAEVAELPFQALQGGLKAVHGFNVDLVRKAGIPISDKAKEELTGLSSEAGTLALVPEIPKIARKTVSASVPKNLPEKLAAKAGKFTGTPEQVLKKANIALREKINPANLEALERLDKAVSKIDDDVSSYIKSEDFIKTDNALRHIEPFIEQVRKKELTPSEAIGEIRGKVEQIYKERGEQIPADLAHQLKKGIYKKDKSAYEAKMKTGAEPSYETKTEMKVAEGILGELKKMYPEIEPLLKRESELMSIKGDVRRTVRNELVKSPLPNGLLAAFSPKWWLAKTLATNKSLEYGVGRILYRARGEKGYAEKVKAKQEEPPPYQRPESAQPNDVLPTSPPQGGQPVPVGNQPTIPPSAGNESGTPIPQFTQPSNVDLVYNELNKRGLKGLAYSYKSGERLTMPERKIVEQVEDGILYPQESPKLDLSTGLPPVNAIGAEFRKANPIDDKISAYRKPIEDKLIEKGETPENLAKLDDTELVKLAEEKEAYIPPPVGEIGAVTKAGKPITEVLANDKEGNTVVASKLEGKMNADKTAEQIAQESLDAKAMKYFGKKFDKLTTAEIIEMRKRK